MRSILILLLLFFSQCLTAKKSPFDFRSPNVLLGSLFFSFFGDYSVSGIITGFTTGTLVLQNNLANDLTLSPNTIYSFGGLKRGTIYSITIKSNPVGYVCSIENFSGVISTNVTNANITCNPIAITALYPQNGSNWNDYINKGSGDIFSQPDTACNTSNTGGYRTCIHAGEIRSFELPSRSSCTNLSATDNLDALNWICKTNSKGSVTFYSTALKRGKYLSNLIDWNTSSWQNLTITIKDGSTTLAVSNPIKLWSNTIDTTEPATPSTSGTIYLYGTATFPTNIIISANKIALLINPNGIKLIRSAGTCNSIAGIDITNRSFVWLEGNMDFGNSTQNSYGISLTNSKFSVFKNIRIQNTGVNCITTGNINNAINLNGSSNDYFEDIYLGQTFGTSPANGNGLLLTASDDNVFNGISISNMATDGIQLNSSKGNTIINATVMSSPAECVLIQSSSNNNSFLNLTTVNSNNYGVRSVGSGNGLFQNSVFFNHLNHGLSLFTGSSITVQNLIASNNNSAQVNLNTTSSYFTGIIKTSSTTCINSASSGGVTSTCQPVSPSDFSAPISISPSYNPFVGYSATDSKNTTANLSGNPSGIALASMTDWVRFDHLYKGIGKFNSASFPSTFHLGVCNSANCTIWDFSLKTSDTILRNGNIPSASSCPTTTITHSFSTTTVTFLKNSIEILNDGVGNENGLCEANEDCLLTPNIGSYQGHGNLVSASSLSGCNDITSLGIKLYQYESNGY